MNIFVQVNTQCCRLREDVADLGLELGVESGATVVELIGLPKLNS